jgi:hypothetical protein
VTTASVFFHRFYMRHSLRAFKYEVNHAAASHATCVFSLLTSYLQDIAPTCLYLALKVEERGTVKIHHVARATKMKVDVHGDHVCSDRSGCSANLCTYLFLLYERRTRLTTRLR